MLPLYWLISKRILYNRVIILSAHISGTDGTAVFFSGVILNNKESNRIYNSANVSTFLIVALEVGSLFYAKYK